MKKILFCAAAAAVVMLALPWLAVRFLRGDAGMAVCFLLFFAVDPLFSLAAGIFAGGDLRRRFFLPLIPPLFFLAGVWLLFDPGEAAFLLYAGAYLVLGAAAMLIAAFFGKRQK